MWRCSKAALEGKGPQRRSQKRLDRRLEEVAKAVGGGYCRLQMPLKLAVTVRETVAGHSLGALEEGGFPPFQCIPGHRLTHTALCSRPQQALTLSHCSRPRCCQLGQAGRSGGEGGSVGTSGCTPFERGNPPLMDCRVGGPPVGGGGGEKKEGSERLREAGIPHAEGKTIFTV